MEVAERASKANPSALFKQLTIQLILKLKKSSIQEKMSKMDGFKSKSNLGIQNLPRNEIVTIQVALDNQNRIANASTSNQPKNIWLLSLTWISTLLMNCLAPLIWMFPNHKFLSQLWGRGSIPTYLRIDFFLILESIFKLHLSLL